MRKQGVADVSFCTFFSKNAIRKSVKTDCGKVGYTDCRPFAFTGKDPRKGWRIPLNEIKYNEQRDEETGYGYFGARYMDHELTTMWLSVDPMSKAVVAMLDSLGVTAENIMYDNFGG